MKIDLTKQLYPVSEEKNKSDFLIQNKKDLLNQLESLKDEAQLEIRSPMKIGVFYKDFNALNIAIDIIKNMEE